jgi:membrane fusion protein (multidrug efflux system)
MNDSSQAQFQQQHTVSNRPTPKRKRLILIAMIVIIAVGLCYGGWLMFFAGRDVSTDNAYTAVEVTQITPLIGGPVKQVKVTDTEAVHAGDVLVVIDDTDAKIAVAQAEAELARVKRQVRQVIANDINFRGQVELRDAEIRSAESDLAKALAVYEKASIDEKRRHNLVEGGAVSRQEFTDAQTQLREASATVEQARARVAVAKAARMAATGARKANDALISDSTVDTNPAVLAAAARLEQARINLARTVLRAPVDGIVTQRNVDVGQQVQAGSRLMSIVPINQIYVDANFKESQLRRVRPGQPVRLTSDLYGDDVIYHGRVEGFAGGSGSALATIPAQNATGNWIKVVQRLPVRIRLDPGQLAEHPLRVGLSMEVTVNLTDTIRNESQKERNHELE